MNFESLANELLLESFEYLDAVHLFHAFFGLKSRFDSLLLIHIRSYHLDFRLVTKYNFDVICETYLPAILNRITTLHLTNDDEIMNMSELLFFHGGFTLDVFRHLQSISFYRTRSSNRLNQLIYQCLFLPHLTHLNIIECWLCDNDAASSYLINNIWSLPQLTHLKLCETIINTKFFSKISHTSTSIESVYIKMLDSTPIDLYRLMEFTPNLQRLCGNSHFFYSKPSQTHSSIISVKIDHSACKNVLINFLQQMPNLSYLTIKTPFICANGNDWEKLFLHHLPNIKVFRLLMTYNVSQGNKEEMIDKLLDSFRTEFWIEKHRWFVRCDWSPFMKNDTALLYTLPYAFDTYHYSQPLCSKSTIPNNKIDWSYDRVHSLTYFYFNRLSNDSYQFHGIFPNIRALSIYLPLIDDLWVVIPTLHHLKSLDVIFTRDGDLVYSQLQTLCDRAHQLYSLTIGANASVQLDFSKIKSTSIRRLNLLHKMQIYTQGFDSVNCTALACSPLGLQCEVLCIEVSNYTNALDLIEQMSNLQSLTFRINNVDEKSAYDELVTWFRTYFPSTYAFTRQMRDLCNIEILIDR